MAVAGCRGISRVLEKLENSIKNGEYYEAHQMYRTLYFRYLNQKKYKELKEMFYQGSMLFLDANQKASGADLGTLLVEVLDKSEDTNYEAWSPKLAAIFLKIGPLHATERESFLCKAVKWSAQGSTQGHPSLHQHIAKIYWDELNYVQARHHYVLSEDGKSCGKLLIEFQLTKGFKSEVDLFVAQAVLQFLCLRNQNTANQTFTTYTENHPRIRKTEPPYLLPLLNFIWFLLRAVETKKLQTFAVLCEQYQKSIERDPCYLQYLDKIGQIFFGVKPPAKKKSGGLFGNFIESFLGGLDDESDDEVNEPNRPQAASTSRRLVENADLD
ncbi:Golgi to ER traffic protein 4 homolog [Anthonomus grandis grandis]|uniref:Golgi to ER traffic protein 4 homolog n=1 Tax=Anthonomus grandis grandis TaxID=2921223 RepID=UPI002164F0B7|nr:Golgi to ER traffic protein 4 homolog [Anthonomus grandis grandis]XP_050295516.1 Golgi to ER traffic protein 4 homolog [Anthonomus grandis grandis]